MNFSSFSIRYDLRFTLSHVDSLRLCLKFEMRAVTNQYAAALNPIIVCDNTQAFGVAESVVFCCPHSKPFAHKTHWRKFGLPKRLDFSAVWHHRDITCTAHFVIGLTLYWISFRKLYQATTLGSLLFHLFISCVLVFLSTEPNCSSTLFLVFFWFVLLHFEWRTQTKQTLWLDVQAITFPLQYGNTTTTSNKQHPFAIFVCKTLNFMRR